MVNINGGSLPQVHTARLILMEALYPKYNSKANINGGSLSHIQMARLILMEALYHKYKQHR